MFSFKRIKTYLKNSMFEVRIKKTFLCIVIKHDRLNGLTMLAVHKNVHIDSEEIINELAKKPRKLDLIL